MKTVTFYHSVICPRCQMAGLSLSSLLPAFPNVEINKVEYLTNLGRAKKEGVRSIPTLVADGQTLVGMYLTKKRIKSFLKSL